MLSARVRFFPNLGFLSRRPVSVRRSYSSPPSSTSSPPSPPHRPVQDTVKVTVSPRDPDIIPIPRQRGPPRMRDGYSGAFYLSILGVALVSTPIITYLYWEHRKAHMTEKKQQMLKEIQARARAS